MAKKKTAEEDPRTGNTDAPPAGARRRSSPRRTADAATTSEEVQLAVARDTFAQVRDTPSYDDIAEAAYRRYLNRGGGHGMDFDDWVAAERELRERR
jgi:Protein of unknown function (DUF2934)